MRPTKSSWRRRLLFALGALTLGAPCCGGSNFEQPSQVTGLRVLAVTADEPYAAAGDMVTLRLTYADALGGPDGNPRPVQVMWLGGCVNPIGGESAACFPQIAGVLGEVLSQMKDPTGLFKTELLAAEKSGAPEAASFDLLVPSNVLEGGDRVLNGTAYGSAYAFFLVCAGTLRPSSKIAEGEFPFECVDANQTVLGADSFVVGYTQVYVFADGRTNANPPINGITFEGTPIEDGEDVAPVATRCSIAKNDPANQGCGRQEPAEECKTYEIEAMVDDVAEPDPEAVDLGDGSAREAIWVDYYSDGGSFTGAKQLINHAENGYQAKHATKWAPPTEAGLYSIWAVVHDARGGMSVTRRFVKVE